MNKYYKFRIILIFIPYINFLSGLLISLSFFRWYAQLGVKRSTIIAFCAFAPALLPIDVLFSHILSLFGMPPASAIYIANYLFMLTISAWWFLLEYYVYKKYIKK